MPSIEMKFWLIPAVSLFSMFCLLKYIWNQWHNDVLFVYEDGSHDSGQHMKNTTGKVKVICRSTKTEMQAQFKQTGLNRSQIQEDLFYLSLNSISNKLFVTFKDQRKLPWFDRLAERQFAVLFLSSMKDDLLNSIKGGTNNNIKVFPPDNKLCNYVTARPHSGAHAEELIMEKFQKLVQAYKSAHKEPFQYVFLYTWLFPCTKCALAITTIIPMVQRAYPEHSSDVSIFILYSGVRKNERKDKLITERSLRSHGINMWPEEDS